MDYYYIIQSFIHVCFNKKKCKWTRPLFICIRIIDIANSPLYKIISATSFLVLFAMKGTRRRHRTKATKKVKVYKLIPLIPKLSFLMHRPIRNQRQGLSRLPERRETWSSSSFKCSAPPFRHPTTTTAVLINIPYFFYRFIIITH